jgi:predicted hydrolase (HD superfamily)
MLTRDEALTLVKKHVSKESNLKHMIAVGAVMKELAARLGEDPVRWEMVGILHDIDFEKCTGLTDHTLIARELLKGAVDDEVVGAIMAHNWENTGVALDTRMKKALVASDAVSGLIVAAALVMPSKKLAEVKPESLIKKYKSKEFARGASRERMVISAEFGVPLEEFLTAALEGMKKVVDELGL